MMNRLNRKLFSLIVAVLVAVALCTSCFPITQEPYWDAFRDQLLSDYAELTEISKGATNAPFVYFDVYGSSITKERQIEIAKDIVYFVASEDGYSEILAFHQSRAKMDGMTFQDININIFDDTLDEQARCADITFQRDLSIADSNLDKLRGFTTGTYWEAETGEYETINLL